MPTAQIKPAPDKVMPPSDEVRQRIASIKQRHAQPEPDIKQFDYDPDQPLHLLSPWNIQANCVIGAFYIDIE